LAYVLAPSKDEAKSLVENGIRLCGNCMIDMLADRVMFSGEVRVMIYSHHIYRIEVIGYSILGELPNPKYYR